MGEREEGREKEREERRRERRAEGERFFFKNSFRMSTLMEDCIIFYFCQICTPCPVRGLYLHALLTTVKRLRFYPAYKLGT